MLLDRPLSTSLTDTEIKAQLSVVLDKMSLKDASSFVAATHGLSKRYVYSLALSIRDVSEEK